MRKIFNTILALAAGVCLSVSCQDKVEDLNFATALSVDKDAIELNAAGAQVELQLTANGDWVAVAPDWLRVEPGSGSGNAVLVVSAPVNENEFQEMMGPRNQKLYIYGEGVKLEIPIKQAGLDALDATRIFKKISSAQEFEAGKAYLMVFSMDDSGTLYTANAWPGTPGNGRYEWWCQKPPVVEDVDGTIIRPDGSESVKFIAVEGGYALQEPGGGYLYQSKNKATQFYSAASVAEGDVWTVSFNEAGQAVITNITEEHSNGVLQYLKGSYQEFACYPDYPAKDCHPIVLYKDEAAPSDEILNVEEVTVEADVTQATIPVTSNKTWTVRNHDGWIKSFAKNEAGDAIDVTFDIYEGGTEDRTATFTVIGETTYRDVVFTQKAPRLVITVTDKVVAIDRTVDAGVVTNSKGEISYVSADPSIAKVDATGVITGVAVGETTITVSVEEYDIYPAGSADFKVTVTATPPTVNNVAGITAQITSTSSGSPSPYEAELTGAVVTYVNGNNAFIEDASGAILFYKKDHGLKAGDTLSGKLSGTGYKFRGLPEITGIGTEFTKGSGGNIPLTEMTIAQLLANFEANYSRRIVVKGVTVTDGLNGSSDRNGKISQGDSEIALYDKVGQVVIADGSEGDLIAYPCPNNDDKQLAVWQTSDFTPAGEVKTVITVSDMTVRVGETVNAGATTNSTGTLSYSSGNEQVATVAANGDVTGVAEGEAIITVSVPADGDYDAAETTFKVTVTAAPLPSTVAEITAQITSTSSSSPSNYEADLAGAVVTYVNGNNVFIEDASGAILFYKKDHGLKAGDTISGKLSGTGYKYNGLPEITSIGTAFTKGSGGIIPLTEITLSALLADFDANISRRVLIKGVTVTDGVNGPSNDRNGEISQGNDKIALYDKSKKVVYEQGAEGNLIAYPCPNKETKQLAVFETDDFIPAGQGLAPTIDVSDKTVYVGETVDSAVQTDSSGEKSYSSSNEQIATVDKEGIITGVAEGEATITVSVAADDIYEAGEATFKVTVTERPLPSTVAEITAQITSTSSSSPSNYEANLTGAVVTYVNGNNVFIEDASGAILFYKKDHGLKAGDTILGKLSGTGYKYNGLPEITSIGTAFTKGSGGIIPLTEITLSALLADFDANISRRVLIKGVTVTDGVNGPSNDRNGEISQGNDKIALYDKSKKVVYEQGAEGNLIAYPCPNKETKQLAVFETDDFTPAGQGTKPTITVSDKTVCVGETVNGAATTNSSGAVSYSSSNEQIATVDQEGIITGVAEGEATITVSVAADDIYEAGEATFKVTVQPAELPTTVAEILDQITSTTETAFSANLTDAIITFVSVNNAYLEDSSGAVLIYFSGHGFQKGDILSGPISGKGKIFNGLKEITAIDNEVIKTPGGEIRETEMTLADLLANYDANMSRRIVLKGVTVTGAIAGSDRDGEIEQNGSKIALRAQNNNCNIAADATGDLVAFPAIYAKNQTTTLQLAIHESSQFTPAGQELEPNLDVEDKTVKVGGTVAVNAQTVSTGELTYSSDNEEVATVDARGTITGVAEGETTIHVYLAAAAPYVAKEAFLIVTVTADTPGGNDGSLEHPYTASEAAALALAGDTNAYYITGKVTKVQNQPNAQYKTCNFWIDENGKAQNIFEGYKIKYIGNVDWIYNAHTLLEVGDEVVIYGELTVYNNTVAETKSGYIVSWNGKTKGLSIPTITAAPDNDTKQIAVAWTAATGSEQAVSYVVKCGTQSYNATAAGSHTFTMADYGTYQVSVEASASDAISSKPTTSVTLTNPAPPAGSKTYTIVWNATNNSGKISGYTNTWTVTSDGLTCNMTNWNNNNNGWEYVKCGSKNAAMVATIDAQISEAIKTVKLNISALTASKINSIKLYVGSDVIGEFSKATGEQSVTIPNPATEKTYKIEVDCQQGSSNGLLTVDKLIFTTD